MCAEHKDAGPHEFLAATRKQYESRRRISRVEPATSAADATPEPAISVQAELQDLRAAQFLVATRELREATERANRRAAGRHTDGGAAGVERTDHACSADKHESERAD